ncbi:hypothetical protein GCM10027590_00810 [Nocardiopsis nanhaiensis]
MTPTLVGTEPSRRAGELPPWETPVAWCVTVRSVSQWRCRFRRFRPTEVNRPAALSEADKYAPLRHCSNKGRTALLPRRFHGTPVNRVISRWAQTVAKLVRDA